MQKREKDEIFNYRNIYDIHDRINFSNKIRNKGLGNIPIVINVNDLKMYLTNNKKKTGDYRDDLDIEIIINMDCNTTQLIDKIKEEYLDKNINLNILLKLENDIILNKNDNLGDIYKKYRNQNDKILYIIVSITKFSQFLNYIYSYIW